VYRTEWAGSWDDSTSRSRAGEWAVRQVQPPAVRGRSVSHVRDDPAWVPPMRMSVHDRISPKNPANEHQDTRLWLARRQDRPVGRIGACVDTFFNELPGCVVGLARFLRVPRRPEVANALFDTACRWVKSKGATTAVGPASFTTNDDLGLLVDGFEYPPVFSDHPQPALLRAAVGRRRLAAGHGPVGVALYGGCDRTVGAPTQDPGAASEAGQRDGPRHADGRLRTPRWAGCSRLQRGVEQKLGVSRPCPSRRSGTSPSR